MNVLIIMLKTFFVYILVAVIFRFMGKKEVGQLGTFDLVVFILIAEFAALYIEHKQSVLMGLVPVISLTMLEYIISKISLKSTKFRKLVDGKPTIIIKKGVINFKNMVELRYTLDDLLLQLRQKDVKSIDEVDYAVLEVNGKLSVFKKDDKKNKDVYPLPIIIDGKVEFNNLYSINKTKKWLLNILLKRKIKVDDVFYAFCKKDDLYIIKKDDLGN